MAQQIVQDGRQQIDRNDHVDVGDILALGHLKKQRADAEKFAVRSDERCAALGRMGRSDEDRLLQQILPIAGKFLSRDNVGPHSLAGTVGENDGIPNFGPVRIAELHGGQAEPTSACTSPKPVS